MKLSPTEITLFQDHIWSFYRREGRSFAWRNVIDPYKVVISEVMLQQTQTYRVVPKYEQFITAFPSFEFLANATLYEILSVWQGLGYNRRGRYLHELAQQVIYKFHGMLPSLPEQLLSLPGIGPSTAASIAAFAFNIPTVFIETNIRTVFIHFFFQTKDKIHDKQLMPLVAQTVDNNNPREWYYALMDYGVMLKQQTINPSRKSAHYSRQSKFQGSDRQIRGLVIKMLTDTKMISFGDIIRYFPGQKDRLQTIIEGLIKDGLVRKNGQNLVI